MNEKYKEALNLYNQCDYEGAYSIIIDNGLCSTEKGDFLCNECRKQILQQYIYLIKDYIAQEMYGEAKELRQQYYSLYGFTSDLSGIVIPEPIRQIETEEMPILEQDKIIQEVNENIIEERPGFLKNNIILVMCVASLLIGLVGYLVYSYNFKDENIISEQTKELKQNVGEQVVLMDSYYKELKNEVEYWNNVHTKDLASSASMEILYDEQVLFYGKTFTAKQCTDHTISLMRKYNSYSQKLVSGIQYTPIDVDNKIIRCDFVKGVEVNGKYKEYDAYLIFKKKRNNEWYVIVESDKTTDYNLNKMKKKKSH